MPVMSGEELCATLSTGKESIRNREFLVGADRTVGTRILRPRTERIASATALRHCESSEPCGGRFETPRGRNEQGVPQDFEEAAEWYRKAAEQGDAQAQFNLGHCYERGQGVPQDFSEAVKWYRKAAEQGHTSAQENLGACYANGRAVIDDPVQAYPWVKLAEERGCDGATLTLAMMEGVFLSREQFREAERRYHQLRSSRGLDAPRKID